MVKELREYYARQQWAAAASEALQNGSRFYMLNLKGLYV